MYRLARSRAMDGEALRPERPGQTTENSRLGDEIVTALLVRSSEVIAVFCNPFES
jgi:hypothetical protein